MPEKKSLRDLASWGFGSVHPPPQRNVGARAGAGDLRHPHPVPARIFDAIRPSPIRGGSKDLRAIARRRGSAG